MIIIKSEEEIALMRESGKVTGEILRLLEPMIRPGISTGDIDNFVETYILDRGMIPSFKGYNGYPSAACVSVNEVVVHRITTKKRILKEGDIVSVDVGTTFKGYVSDAARTYGVGVISAEAERLIKAAEDSFFAGLNFCKVGHRLSDISHAIQKAIEKEGFSVIREFVGHGVGRAIHEEPQIPNFGKPGRGPRLAEGMVLAIEPMLAMGTYEIDILSDNWTAVTLDGKYAAHYENTVVITQGEPELLTL